MDYLELTFWVIAAIWIVIGLALAIVTAGVAEAQNTWVNVKVSAKILALFIFVILWPFIMLYAIGMEIGGR